MKRFDITISEPSWHYATEHQREYCEGGEFVDAEIAAELLEALEMVRDADDDCKMDGLPTIPGPARAKIDAAIAKAKGQA